MKSNLSVSATSSYQDQGFPEDLQYNEAPLKIDSPTINELSEAEYRSYREKENPAPGASPEVGNVDNSSFSFGAGDQEDASVKAFDFQIDGESTTARAQQTPDIKKPEPEPPSNFDYLLIAGISAAVMLFGWLLLRLFTRRLPTESRRRTRSHQRDGRTSRNSTTMTDKPRGQFKRSERFLKPREKAPEEDQYEGALPLTVVEGTEVADPNVLEGKLTQRHVGTMPTDQPVDDYEFDLSGAGSDSDVFSVDEAAEINRSAGALKSGTSSKRFKTEESSAINDFEVDDEFVAFDDEDSQLSLADSDTDFGFDLDDEDSDNLLDSSKQVLETSAANIDSVGESDFGFDLDEIDSDDSGEFSFDEASPAAAGKAVPVVDSEENDSSEFGFGLFDDESSDKEAVEVANEISDDEPSVTAPVVAAATGLGAGLAAIGLGGTGSADTSESDRQWEAKFSELEDQNAKLNSQVMTLTKQLEKANKSGAQTESLQQEHDALTETVKSLGLEKEQLLKEKELAVKEKTRLAEELEAAEKKDSTWEQEKADLLKQQEELKAEKEAEKNRLAKELEAAEKKSSTWEQEKANLLKQQEELKAEKEAEKTRLAEELKAAEKKSSTWEQEKANLLKQQEELKAKKEAEEARLAKELKAAEKKSSTWEQEKAGLLKQQEELKAKKEAEEARLAKELKAAEKKSSTWEQEKAGLLKQQEELKAKKAAEEARLAKELKAAEKKSSAWEQEKADLLKQQEELKAKKEAEKARLAKEKDSTWEQEKAGLLKQQEELKAKKEAEEARLAKELKAAEKKSSAWEQEKAGLLKQQEELKAEKEAEKARLAKELKVAEKKSSAWEQEKACLLYTSPSPRDRTRSRMPSSA